MNAAHTALVLIGYENVSVLFLDISGYSRLAVSHFLKPVKK